MLSDLKLFMIFVWIIGWLIACGMNHTTCDTVKKPCGIAHYIVLFFTWPHYIGYSIG